jgi:predicted ferric reductase
MKTLLAGLMALITATWAWHAVSAGGGSPLWLARQEALYLSGLLSIGLMSLSMFLAARPVWVERPLGGLDRMYRTHKWAGILAVSFAALHWLIEMSDDVLKALVGREGRIAKIKDGGLLESLRHLAEDMGEWAIYALLAMLVLTLWRRFSYRPWRFLHQAMPLLYLMLAFHAVLLAPADYWTQPPGWLLALLLIGGAYGSVVSLAGRIGRARQVQGSIIAVEQTAVDILSVTCQLDPGWRGHRPGQFAFVTFDPGEGAHPYTLASADQGDCRVRFEIKALGDYTRTLAKRLSIGQHITLEGPYGRFDFARHNPKATQIWVAGGIGVTPFLAWLEAMQAHPETTVDADLHYCTRDRGNDPYVSRLENLCQSLPDIRLQVHGSRQGEELKSANLVAGVEAPGLAEVWFCGPQGLVDSLQNGLREAGQCHIKFHQEAFALR